MPNQPSHQNCGTGKGGVLVRPYGAVAAGLHMEAPMTPQNPSPKVSLNDGWGALRQCMGFDWFSSCVDHATTELIHSSPLLIFSFCYIQNKKRVFLPQDHQS